MAQGRCRRYCEDGCQCEAGGGRVEGKEGPNPVKYAFSVCCEKN
jgi:hypothetical protein